MEAQQLRVRTYLVKERHLEKFYLVFWINLYVDHEGEMTRCFKQVRLFETTQEARDFGELKGFEVV